MNIGNYTLKERLGGGQFSEVYFGQGEQGHVAIKVIDLAKLADPVLQILMNNEIQVLKVLTKCPNILTLYAAYKQSEKVYIITEYCNQGDLQQQLNQQSITESYALKIFVEILNGLVQLQKNYVIHRDIKPANIFIKDGLPKLADFGFAICKTLNSNAVDHYNVGTPIYMAPESLIDNQYSFRSDLWAAGVILYEMIFKMLPFPGKTEKELVQLFLQHKSRRLTYPFMISQDLDNLLQGMLSFNRETRWTAEQSLAYVLKMQDTQNNNHNQNNQNNNQQEQPKHRQTLSRSDSLPVHPEVQVNDKHTKIVQTFVMLLIKIYNIINKTPQFVIQFKDQQYSNIDVLDLQNKLLFCIAYAIQQLMPSEGANARLQGIRNQIQTEQIDSLLFTEYNEALNHALKYLKENILITNHFFEKHTHMSDSRLIVFLDYCVILYQVIKFYNGSWSNLHSVDLTPIIEVQIKDNITREEYNVLSLKIISLQIDS